MSEDGKAGRPKSIVTSQIARIEEPVSLPATLPGFSRGGGQAAVARLNLSRSLAVDVAGNLFIADGNNSRIQRVPPGGVIATVAPSGLQVAGGPNISASIGAPDVLAIDAAGNLVVAPADGRVRKISRSGIISTVAGARRQWDHESGARAIAATGVLPIVSGTAKW